jgi:hypothetical protein
MTLPLPSILFAYHEVDRKTNLSKDDECRLSSFGVGVRWGRVLADGCEAVMGTPLTVGDQIR